MKGEEGEVVVPEGENRDANEDGDEVLELPPPPQPPILPLREWPQTALGKDSLRPLAFNSYHWNGDLIRGMQLQYV